MGPRQDHTGEGGDRQLGQCPEQAGLLGSASQPRRQEPGKEDRSIFRREPFCSKACWCHLASVEERLHLVALRAARAGKRGRRNQAGSQGARLQVWLHRQQFLL